MLLRTLSQEDHPTIENGTKMALISKKIKTTFNSIIQKALNHAKLDHFVWRTVAVPYENKK